jgi:hypothetical protein
LNHLGKLNFNLYLRFYIFFSDKKGNSEYGVYVCKNLDNMLYYLNGDPKSEIVTCFLFEVLYFNPQVVDFPQEQPPGDFDCLWNRTLPDFKKQNSLELYMNSMVIFKPILW